VAALTAEVCDAEWDEDEEIFYCEYCGRQMDEGPNIW
jgi:hypothetical protein